jgi:hypothetical protein
LAIHYLYVDAAGNILFFGWHTRRILKVKHPMVRISMTVTESPVQRESVVSNNRVLFHLRYEGSYEVVLLLQAMLFREKYVESLTKKTVQVVTRTVIK